MTARLIIAADRAEDARQGVARTQERPDMVRIDRVETDMADAGVAAAGALSAGTRTRLLGFAPVAGLDALRAAMAVVPGPDLHAHGAGSCPSVAALFQTEPDDPLPGRDRKALTASLYTVQRRLEIGCQAGPFLAMDPAAACCRSAVLPRLLAAESEALGAALARYGALHQWDIELKWTPHDVVARHRNEIAPAAARGQQALAEAVTGVLRNDRTRREAALLAALGPAVLDFAAGGAACTETSVAVTVLAAHGAEAAVEAALDAMAPEHVDGASIDMRGPLPPLSFFPVRLATVDAQAVAGAWTALGLIGRIDLPGLHRQWRLCAAAAHPDRQPLPGAEAAVSALTDAYRLLRGLLPPVGASGDHTLDSLMRRAGQRLVMPAGSPQRGLPVHPVREQARDPVLELLS